MDPSDHTGEMTNPLKMTIQILRRLSDCTNPLFAKRRLLSDGTIVPVDEAEDAEEESSSWWGSKRFLESSSFSASSNSVFSGMGGSKERPASLVLAKLRWN